MEATSDIVQGIEQVQLCQEAVTVLMQCKPSFSERQRHQLLWSHCVNPKGCIGGNIPCDLHIEHLNRRLKTMLRNVAVTPKVVERAGKCLHLVDNVCRQFERQTASSRGLGYHATPKFGRDLQTVLKVLEEEMYSCQPRENTLLLSLRSI